MNRIRPRRWSCDRDSVQHVSGPFSEYGGHTFGPVVIDDDDGQGLLPVTSELNIVHHLLIIIP
jgi:hypothetical protein